MFKFTISSFSGVVLCNTCVKRDKNGRELTRRLSVMFRGLWQQILWERIGLARQWLVTRGWAVQPVRRQPVVSRRKHPTALWNKWPRHIDTIWKENQSKFLKNVLRYETAASKRQKKTYLSAQKRRTKPLSDKFETWNKNLIFPTSNPKKLVFQFHLSFIILRICFLCRFWSVEIIPNCIRAAQHFCNTKIALGVMATTMPTTSQKVSINFTIFILCKCPVL